MSLMQVVQFVLPLIAAGFMLEAVGWPAGQLYKDMHNPKSVATHLLFPFCFLLRVQAAWRPACLVHRYVTNTIQLVLYVAHAEHVALSANRWHHIVYGVSLEC
jgi:hypothetical protein